MADPRFPDGPSTQAYIKPETPNATPGGDSVKEGVLKNDANVSDIYRILNADLANLTDPDHLLSQIKTVDGVGSGLDADLFDGRDSDTFASVGKTGASLDEAITAGMFRVMTADGPAGTKDGSLIVSRDIGGLHCLQILAGFASDSLIWWRTGRSDDGATFTDWSEWKEFGSGGGELPDPLNADTLDFFDSGEFVRFAQLIDHSIGVGDANKAIKLNASGVLDESFLSVRIFIPSGNFTPTPTAEYPTTFEPGFYWIIEGVGDIVSGGYTFSGGYLAGETIYDDELLVKGRDDVWAIIHSKVDPTAYYKLDGTLPLAADFQAGGFKLVSLADGVADTDAVTMAQLAEKLDVDGKAADSTLFDTHPVDYFALADHFHLDATQSESGFMSSFDKTKLDNISPGAGWDPETSNVMELGAELGLDSSVAIDFHSRQGADYDFRIIRDIGENGSATLQQLGTGNIEVYTQGGLFRLNNSQIWTDSYHPGGGNMTPQEILDALKTVDGPGSGLNADFIDNLHASDLSLLDKNNMWSGQNQYSHECVRNSPVDGFNCWRSRYDGKNVFLGQINGSFGYINMVSSVRNDPPNGYSEPLWFVSNLNPYNTNTYDMGEASHTWREGFFSVGMFLLGDETKVRNVSTISSLDADFLMHLVPKAFEVIPTGVENDPILADVTPSATARTRLGFIAQDVDDALIAEGYDPDNYCLTTGKDGDRCVNPGELIALLVKKVQELEARVNSLENP